MLIASAAQIVLARPYGEQGIHIVGASRCGFLLLRIGGWHGGYWVRGGLSVDEPLWSPVAGIRLRAVCHLHGDAGDQRDRRARYKVGILI